MRTANARLWTGAALFTLLACALILLCAFPPTLHYRLDPAKIEHQQGFLYRYPLRRIAPFPYRLAHDSAAGNAATLALYENGKPLGPPHALHQSIADQGRGAYSLWYSTLFFSTADNSDPRSGANELYMTAPLEPRVLLAGATILVTVVAVVLVTAAIGPAISRRLGKRAGLVIGLVAAATASAVVCLGLTAPTVAVPLNSRDIIHDKGAAYIVTLLRFAGWPYATPAQPSIEPLPPDIRVTENGRPIGHYEGSHEKIADNGDGGFDIWRHRLWFSSSDNSDPRDNGRRYELIVPLRLNALSQWLGVAGFLIATVCFCRSFRRPAAVAWAFWIPVVAGLAGFTMTVLDHPMPVLWSGDSFGYFSPGALLATGHDIALQSIRGIGYPALIAGTVRLGTLRELPAVQLALSLVSVASAAAILFLFVRRLIPDLACLLGGAADAVIPAAASMVSLGFTLLVVSHDAFVLNIYWVMAEAPHTALTALALLLFVLGWVSRRGRIAFATGAVFVTFLSTLVKPMTLVALVLATLSLLWILWSERAKLRSPLNLPILALAAVGVAGLHHLDNMAASAQARLFGQQTLFCNHIPIVLSAVGDATPERAELSRRLRHVLAEGPQNGWNLLGYDGDHCFYNNDVYKNLEQIVAAEHTELGTWLLVTFLKGVIEHPIIYAEIVGDQLGGFFAHPAGNITEQDSGSMPDGDWRVLKPYRPLIGLPHQAFARTAVNWLALNFDAVAGAAKWLLHAFDRLYRVVVPLAMLVAAGVLIANRTHSNDQPEIVVLSSGVYLFSYVLLIALSHTFDIGRYKTGLFPLSLLLFVVSGLYLCHRALFAVLELSRRPVASRLKRFRDTISDKASRSQI